MKLQFSRICVNAVFDEEAFQIILVQLGHDLWSAKLILRYWIAFLNDYPGKKLVIVGEGSTLYHQGH